MLCAKHPPQRNTIDLTDHLQVKTLTKRLGISTAALHKLVEKSGNSIGAICKEAELQRATNSAKPAAD